MASRLRHDKYKKYLRMVDFNYQGTGFQYIFTFPNNYGASVAKGPGTYGWEDDKWELAVLYKGHVTYNKPLIKDVLGHLSDEDVNYYLGEIKRL